MRLILPLDIQQRLIGDLRIAGVSEIGGLLMGEHVGPNIFRILDVTVDHGGGSYARFVRVIRKHGRGLIAFFRRTGSEYRRFNYIGEWHSHPSFGLNPSATDIETMRNIVDDPSVGANFAALVIVRLSEEGLLQGKAIYFVPSPPDAMPVDLVLCESM